MSGEIVNRVANSKLITFDLEDYFPEGERRVLDISDWLFEGFILKEKEFRESCKTTSMGSIPQSICCHYLFF